MFTSQDQVFIQFHVPGREITDEDPLYHFRRCEAMKTGTYTVVRLHRAKVMELDPCQDCTPVEPAPVVAGRYDGYAALDE